MAGEGRPRPQCRKGDKNGKKYKFTEEVKEYFDITLHRIEALRDFGDVKAGDLGGWIEKEENLSHDGNARVCGDARVCDGNSIMWISCIGSRNDTVTFCRSAKGNIMVGTGCFLGTIDDFAAAVEKTHGDNEHGKAYKLAIELAKLRIKTDFWGEENRRWSAVIMNNEDLRRLCIDRNWFTRGSNRQYDKLFEANEQGAPLGVIATIIWVCSEDVERSEVVLELIDSIDRHNEKLMGYVE